MALERQYLESNGSLRQKAKETLRGRWGEPIVLCLVIGIISGLASGTGVGTLLISGALTLGLSIYFLKLVRGEEVAFERGFDGFNHFGSSLILYLLMSLFVILWTLLLIIPGIIKALAYSQAFYILADDRDIGVMEALEKSQKMMRGAKGKLFLMGINFAILGILCLFTLGIGYLWLVPWMNTVTANFYEDLKRNYQE